MIDCSGQYGIDLASHEKLKIYVESHN